VKNPWVTALIEEAAVFPNGSHDDMVDAATQALSKLRIKIMTRGQTPVR
jgi:predicted phage terminase large subunit-like protein